MAAAHRLDRAEGDCGNMPEQGDSGLSNMLQADAFHQRSAGQGYPMAGIDLAEMIRADPDADEDQQVEALALCHWAEAKPHTCFGTGQDCRCIQFGVEQSADALARAHALAETF